MRAKHRCQPAPVMAATSGSSKVWVKTSRQPSGSGVSTNVRVPPCQVPTSRFGGADSTTVSDCGPSGNQWACSAGSATARHTRSTVCRYFRSNRSCGPGSRVRSRNGRVAIMRRPGAGSWSNATA